jgi:hypothetical protein
MLFPVIKSLMESVRMNVYVLTNNSCVQGVYTTIENAAVAITGGEDIAKFHTICAHFETCGRFGKWALQVGVVDTQLCGAWNVYMR